MYRFMPIKSLYKCQIFKLYIFYVLFVLQYNLQTIHIWCLSYLLLFSVFIPAPPPRRSMCGRHASYWNAFLFVSVFKPTSKVFKAEMILESFLCENNM